MGFVTGRLIMTVFPLLTFFEYFELVLAKIRQLELPKQYNILMLGDLNAHCDVTDHQGISSNFYHISMK